MMVGFVSLGVGARVDRKLPLCFNVFITFIDVLVECPFCSFTHFRLIFLLNAKHDSRTVPRRQS